MIVNKVRSELRLRAKVSQLPFAEALGSPSPGTWAVGSLQGENLALQRMFLAHSAKRDHTRIDRSVPA
jgi:hypothetical protein